MATWPPRFTIEPRGIAGFFLRYRVGTEGDLEALTGLLEECYRQGRRDMANKARELYRERHQDRCLISSEGAACTCFLCATGKETTP